MGKLKSILMEALLAFSLYRLRTGLPLLGDGFNVDDISSATTYNYERCMIRVIVFRSTFFDDIMRVFIIERHFNMILKSHVMTSDQISYTVGLTQAPVI